MGFTTTIFHSFQSFPPIPLPPPPFNNFFLPPLLYLFPPSPLPHLFPSPPFYTFPSSPFHISSPSSSISLFSSSLTPLPPFLLPHLSPLPLSHLFLPYTSSPFPLPHPFYTPRPKELKLSADAGKIVLSIRICSSVHQQYFGGFLVVFLAAYEKN